MYSKDALDLYEDLLEKVATDVQFELTTKEAKVNPFVSMYSGIKRLRIPGVPSTPQAAASTTQAAEAATGIHPAWITTGLAAAGIPIAYNMRDKVDQAQQDWDKLKYGIGGLGVGLALPYVYDKLSQNGFPGLLGAVVPALAGNTQQQISDFTSI